MILTTAAFLILLGLGTWVIGAVFEYSGVAVIGATLVIGVGAMFTATGLKYQSGETVDNNLTTNQSGNDTEIAVNNSTTTYEYTNVQTPTRLPLGILVMLLGGAFALRGIDISRGGA